MTFRFTDGERHIFRRRARISVSRWAAANIVVPDGPYSGGRFRLDVNPYLSGIIDTWGLPWVMMIVVVGAPQTGKTLGMYVCIAYSADRRSGPRMLTMPDDETLDRVSKGKLRPLLKMCTPVRRIIEKIRAGVIRFKDATALYLSSAQSPAQRASISVMDMFMDEEALYKQIAGQGMPVVDFIERTRSYYRKRKIYRSSKPVGDEDCSILQAYENEVDERRHYEAKCPACGTLQEMVEDGLVALEGCKDPGEILRRELARYKCAHCGYFWSDHSRDVAVAAGRWVAADSVPRPARVGFYLPAVLSQAVSLSEILAAKIRAKESDSPDVKQAYDNGYWARAYTAAEIAPEANELLELREPDLKPRTVPKEAVALTCGIDMQKRFFRFSVWAWADGLRSWMIDYGKLREWDDVRALVELTTYQREDGRELPIWRTAIDTGGGLTDPGVLTRTEECYQFLRLHPLLRIHGTKGRSTSSMTAVTWSVMDKMPKSKRPIPGGLTLFLLDVNYLKGLLFGRLSPDARQPARFYDAPEEELADFLDQLTAERLVRGRDGRMRWLKVKRCNDYLDTAVLAHACAEGSWTPGLQALIDRDKALAAMPKRNPAEAKKRTENPYTGGM